MLNLPINKNYIKSKLKLIYFTIIKQMVLTLLIITVGICFFNPKSKSTKNLKQIRKNIDKIDKNLLRLFQKRMDCSTKVAEYKKQHNKNVFNKQREDEIIHNIKKNADLKYKNSAALLFSSIMNISRYLQYDNMQSYSDKIKYIINKRNTNCAPSKRPKIGCFGIEGSYSNQAALKKFPNSKIINYRYFSEIFDAVNNNKVDFGIVPINNSSAGSVNMVYNLLNKNNLYINDAITLKISHCIATNPNNNLKIKQVISHPQALEQCSDYISSNNYNPISYDSSAAAALFVSQNNNKSAAICSKNTAKLYNLKILDENIQNNQENYTKFIVISKELYLNNNQNAISIIVTIPNSVGSLNKLLTNFSVRNVNIIKIESQPIGNKGFDVMFYIDFYGNLNNISSINLINSISMESENFKFLGCYKEDSDE